MEETKEVISYQHKTQYYETDQMGVIHHSNYIRWFEEARTNLLKKMGLSYRQMEECGVIIPVLGISCEYKSMVKFDDIVDITCKITFFNGVKFTVAYEIIDASSGELRTTGETRHCFLNKEHKPFRLAKEQPLVYDTFLDLLDLSQNR